VYVDLGFYVRYPSKFDINGVILISAPSSFVRVREFILSVANDLSLVLCFELSIIFVKYPRISFKTLKSTMVWP